MVAKLNGSRGEVLIRPVGEIHEVLHRRFRVSKHLNNASSTGVDTIDYFDLIAEHEREIWPTSLSSELIENTLWWHNRICGCCITPEFCCERSTQYPATCSRVQVL